MTIGFTSWPAAQVHTVQGNLTSNHVVINMSLLLDIYIYIYEYIYIYSFCVCIHLLTHTHTVICTSLTVCRNS